MMYSNHYMYMKCCTAEHQITEILWTVPTGVFDIIQPLRDPAATLEFCAHHTFHDAFHSALCCTAHCSYRNFQNKSVTLDKMNFLCFEPSILITSYMISMSKISYERAIL